MVSLSVAIIARNEELNIQGCLESVAWADEIVVLDGFSTDKTYEIAKRYTQHVPQKHMTLGFGEHKNAAMKATTGDWILVLDADERITEDSKQEILEHINNPGDNVAFAFPRLTSFHGRVIWGSGWYETGIIRLVKRDCGLHDDAWVHEVIVPTGPTGRLNFPLIHHTYRDVTHHMEKLQLYTTLNAKDWHAAGVRIRPRNMPWYFVIKPFLIFWRKLILMNGIRDGYHGIVIALMSAFQYFGSYVKLWELQQKVTSGTKILILHETAQVAGAEKSLLNLVSNLSDEYHTEFVLPEKGVLTERLTEKEIPWHIRELPGFRNPLAFLRAQWKLHRLLKSGGFDIVHGNSPRTNLHAGIAGKLSGCKVVFHARNLLTTEKIDPDRLLSPLADALLCNSAAICDRFKGIKQAEVVMNGVNIAEYSPEEFDKREIRQEWQIAKETIVIGITSRFGPDKGHEEFFRAAQKLDEAGQKDFCLLVVGDAVFAADKAREQMLNDLVDELNLRERTIFTGYRRDVNRLLAAMDIFVLAAHQEPCGRVLFEAQAMEVPVVGTNTGGTPEIVEDGVTGILIPPKNPEKMAQALQELIENPRKRRAMGFAARRRVKALFPIRNNAEKTRRAYDRILKKG